MIPGGPIERGGRRLALYALALVAFLAVSEVPAQASASLFTNTGSVCSVSSMCLQAGSFGVLVGQYNAITTVWTAATASVNNSTINGEIGVGSGSGITFTGNQNRTWEGPIDFADALTTSSGYCGASGTTTCQTASGTNLTNGSRRVRVTDGTSRQEDLIETAMDQMRRISNYWATEWDDTPGNVVTALGTTLGTTTTALGAAGQVKVYSATTVNTTGAITISGDANSLVIVNITGTSSTTTAPVRLNHDISLSGGITADQVFFNILSTNTNVSSTAYAFQATTSGRTLNGVYYVAADSYTVSTQFGGTGAGQGARFFGGVGSNAWGANFTLNAPPDATPEPSTYVLMVSGLGAFLYARKRRGKEKQQ